MGELALKSSQGVREPVSGDGGGQRAEASRKPTWPTIVRATPHPRVSSDLGLLSNQAQRDSKASLYPQSPFASSRKWGSYTREKEIPSLGQGQAKEISELGINPGPEPLWDLRPK